MLDQVTLKSFFQWDANFYPTASKASREVADLTERKNLLQPYIKCHRICLSICLPVGLSLQCLPIKNDRMSIFRQCF